MPGAWDTARVRHGDAVVPQRVGRDMVSAGEGAREQLQSVGAIEEVGVERDPGHHAGLRYEFALLGGRPSERATVWSGSRSRSASAYDAIDRPSVPSRSTTISGSAVWCELMSCGRVETTRWRIIMRRPS